ncbi:MAG: PPC domain-containing protein, partial [Phycicoccus sp.]
QVNLGGIATNSQVRWIAVNPYGVPVDPTATTQCYTNFSDKAACNPTSRSYADPLPGVWEIYVESRRTSPFLDNPFRITAAAQGVEVTPEVQEVPAPAAGGSAPVTWTAKNLFGAVTATPTGGSLGSAVDTRRSIADGASEQFEVAVPAGASRLTVTIGNPSDAGADLDLTVRNAAGAVVGTSADGDSEESVTIADPAAGTYTVAVDGYEVPTGTTEYDYLDVFFAAALGTLDVPDGDVELAGGETVTLEGSVTPTGTAAEGRTLFGEMTLLSPSGAALGRGQVVITP